MATLTSKLIVSLIDQVTAPARGIAGAVRGLQSAQRANRAEMDATRGRMVDAAAAAYAMGRAIAAPVQAAVQFESAMADVRKVVDFETPQAFAAMGQDIVDMSTRLPMAANDIAQIVAAAGAAGMAGDDLLKFAEMATKVGVAFDISADQAGTSMARMKTALGLTVEETGAVADVLNHLSNSMASTAPQLLDYMSRVGSTGLTYGFTIEQTAALGSAMIASGAEAEIAATSLRAVGRALTRGASATGRQADAYEQLGLSSSRVAKAMQEDAVGTLRIVLERIRELPEHMRAAALSDLFGDEARAIAPLLNNLDLLGDSLELVGDRSAYLGSAEEEYASRAATSANNLQLMANQAQAVALAIGNALLPAVNAFAETVKPMLGAIAELVRQNPEAVQAVIGLVGALVALRVTTIAARWAFLFLKGGVLDLALFAVRGAAVVVAASARMRAALVAARAAALGATMLSAIGAAGLFSGLIGWLGGVAAAVAGAAAGITAPLWGVIAAVVLALAAVGIAVWKFWEPISAFFSGFGEVIGAALAEVGDAIAGFSYDRVVDLAGVFGVSPEQVAQAVGAVGAALSTVGQSIVGWFAGLPAMIGDWFGSIFTQVELTDAEAEGYRESGRRMAQAIVDGFSNVGQAIADAFLTVDWVGIGVTLMNSIWEGMKSIIPQMVAGLGSAIASLNPFSGDNGVIGGSGQGAMINGAVDTGLNVPAGAASAAVEGARAAGGSIVGGKTYLVGEHGPELVTPSRSGWVHTADETARMGTRGGNIGPIHLGGIVVNGIQNPGAIVDEVARQLEERLRVMLDGIHADTEYRG